MLCWDSHFLVRPQFLYVSGRCGYHKNHLGCCPTKKVIRPGAIMGDKSSSCRDRHTSLRRVVCLSSLIVLALWGCDQERLDQYSAFATAGSLYVTSFHQLTTQAGTAMIAVDSVVLIRERPNVAPDLQKHPEQYSSRIVQHDKLLQEHLAVLKLLDAHATLLGSYFNAIAKLTDSKTATATSAGATDLLKSIDSMDGDVSKATLGGKTVADYATVGTAFVVAHFQVKALDDQLQLSSPIIDKALSLQEAAVAALAEEIKSSLTDTLANREVSDVINPYLSPHDLPGSWNTNREAYLRASVTLTTVNSAQTAIKQLHNSFKQLVENKSGPVDIQTLVKAVTDMAAYANAADATLKTSPSK